MRRFLAPPNNIFAPSQSYSLVDRQDPMIFSSPDSAHLRMSTDITEDTVVDDQASGDSAPSSWFPNEGGTQLTLLGIARFLDQFAPLYGNPLSKKQQNEQEKMVLAVVQAFSMQWLPPTDSSDAFCDVWATAHNFLVTSNRKKSFRHIYSVFLFHMITAPHEVEKKVPMDETPNALLDDALRELQALAALGIQGLMAPGLPILQPPEVGLVLVVLM